MHITSSLQVANRQTPASRRVQEYLDDLENDLKAKNSSKEDFAISSTDVARLLSDSECTVYNATVLKIAKRKGFKTLTLSEANQKVFATPASKKVHKYFDDLANKLKEKGILPKDFTIYPTDVARLLSDSDCTVSHTTIFYIAKSKGFKIANRSESNQKANETPASKKVRKYFDNLANELGAKGILPKDFAISSREVARLLSDSECPVYQGTVRKAAKRKGFKTFLRSEVNQKRITPASQKVHKYFDDLENDLKAKGMLPKDFTISSREVARSLSDSECHVYRGTVRKIAKSKGFKTLTSSEANQKLVTPACRRVQEYFDGLAKELEAKGILPKDFAISLTDVVRLLSDSGSPVYHSAVLTAAKRKGFKTFTLSEAIQKACETTASKRVHKYFDDLANELKAKDILPKDFAISSTDVARLLSDSECSICKTTVQKIAKREGFKTFTLSESFATSASRKVEEYLDGLANELKEKDILPKDFAISLGEVARSLSDSECHVYRGTVEKIAKRKGFEIALRRLNPTHQIYLKFASRLYNREGKNIDIFDKKAGTAHEVSENHERQESLAQFRQVLTSKLNQLKQEDELCYEVICLQFGLNVNETNFTSENLEMEQIAFCLSITESKAKEESAKGIQWLKDNLELEQLECLL